MFANRLHSGRPAAGALRKATTSVIEQLEARWLLSAYVEDGWWIIDGGVGDDTITVEISPDDPARLRAILNGKVIDQVRAADIDGIDVFGGPGNDVIRLRVNGPGWGLTAFGDEGNDTITGGDDADYLYGGDGDDLIDGGGGDDWIEGEADHDRLSGGPGADSLSGNGGHDTLDGDGGDDWMMGNSGNDTLRQSPGDDRRWGGFGTDTVDGADDLPWDFDGGQLTIHGDTRDDTADTIVVRDAAGAAGFLEVVLNGEVVTTREARTIDLVTIYAGKGNDSVKLRLGDYTTIPADVYAGDGDDTVSGGAEDNYIEGEDGDDSIDPGDGHDEVYGGGGTDDVEGNDWDFYTPPDGEGPAFVDDGTLFVHGDYADSFDDHVIIRQRGDDLSVLEVVVNGQSIFSYAIADLYGVEVHAGEGNDRLQVQLDAGAGVDYVDAYGGPGNDTMVGGAEENFFYGEDGDDSLDGNAGDTDEMHGGPGADTVDGLDLDSDHTPHVPDPDLIDEDLLGDTDVTDHAWIVRGTDGDDTIIIRPNPDDDDLLDAWVNGKVIGQCGAAWISGVRIFAEAGNDLVKVKLDGVTLNFADAHGAEGNDTLVGGAEENFFYGGVGDDSLDGNAGQTDEMHGGPGADTVAGEDLDDDDDDPEGGDDGGAIGQTPDDDVHVSLEDGHLLIDGTDDDDRIIVRLNPDDGARAQILSGNDVIGEYDLGDVTSLLILGHGGDDRLKVQLALSGAHFDVDGGDGNDTLVGGDGRDRLSGGPGDDEIHGGGGNDRIEAGDGHDTAYGNGGDDAIFGGAGDDELEGRQGADFIDGGQGDDWIEGDGGDDEVAGGSGDDWLDGAGGQDQIAGGTGDDQLIGGADEDDLRGQGGEDSVAGGLGEDTLRGGGDDDQVTGGHDDDVVRGKAGEDTLWGGEGTDTIVGGAGPDDIHIEEGIDYAKFSKYDTKLNDQYRNPLKKLDDPAALKAYLIEKAVSRYKALFGQDAYWYYWGGGPYFYATDVSSGVPREVSTGTAPPPVGPVPDFSKTNTQEAGVDEADLVKSDGDYLYLVSGDELVIVDAVPASEMHVVSRTKVGGQIAGLFLAGGSVVVLSSTYERAEEEPSAEDGVTNVIWCRFCGYGKPLTQVSTFDVANRAAPTLIEKTTLDGRLSTSRMVDGRLYVVLGNTLDVPAPIIIPAEESPPETDPAVTQNDVVVDWYQPPSKRGTYETEDAYRARLVAMSLEELLPGYTTRVKTPGDDEVISGGLADVSSIYVPDGGGDEFDDYDNSMFSVVLFNLKDDEAGPDGSTSVVGMQGQIYASEESLYVTATDYYTPMGDWRGELLTDIYKFELGDDSVDLGASGQVPGWVINQFAMDEEGDVFRIATTSSNENGQSNNVFTLRDTGDDLSIIGGITGLAFSERIYSARFLGDRAYLVTFRQVDPLFTIDLSDDESPTVSGILKIPGYSSYLHPVGEDLLIGVGRDATDDGRVRGMQVSLFDVSDMKNPRRLDTHNFGNELSWSSSAAEWDHHAFSYFPAQQILALPLSNWSGGGSDTNGLEILKVDPTTGFTSLGRVDHEHAPLRSVRIGDNLYSIGVDAIKVVDLDHPANVLAELEDVISHSWWGPIWVVPTRVVWNASIDSIVW